jgi:hypothetical protein
MFFKKEQDKPHLTNISSKSKHLERNVHSWTKSQWKYNQRYKWNCEWKVTDKMVKWSDTSENVLRQMQIVQNSAYICNKFTKKFKK